jgi:hypothetical protein
MTQNVKMMVTDGKKVDIVFSKICLAAALPPTSSATVLPS